LADHHYASALDVFTGMGLLAPVHVRDWRRSRIPYLDRVIQGNLHKISRSMHIFRVWAQERGLKPSETAYVARTRGPRRELRFSKSGDPGIEPAYRTRFVSPELSTSTPRDSRCAFASRGGPEGTSRADAAACAPSRRHLRLLATSSQQSSRSRPQSRGPTCGALSHFNIITGEPRLPLARG
jgi:hypothetical protein